MDCTIAQEALSALLDGEDPGGEPGGLEDHLAGCHACRAWRDGAHVITRRARLAVARPAPAPSPALLAEIARERRWPRGLSALAKARLALVAVALVQIAVTVPQLILGSDHEAPIHVAHEMGSFDLALAIGFLVAAWQPARARGMHVLVGAAALLLVGTALIDLMAGATSPADETPHLVAVAGWMLMYRIAKLAPQDEIAADGFAFPRRLRTIDIGAPVWDETSRHLSASADDAREAAEPRRAVG